MFLTNISLFAIISPLLIGFFSFLLKDRKPIFFNAFFLVLVLISFFYLLYSVIALNLASGKEYPIMIGGWSKAMGIELKYNIQNAFVVLFLTLVMIVFLSSVMTEKNNYEIRGFAFIMLCGANGLALTNDVFNSYVFFEIVCITSYIVYSHGKSIKCLKNAYNYIILSGFVGAIFLICIGLLYQITGHLNLDLISNVLKTYSNNKSISAIFILFTIAMIFKIGVYPLHNILTEIYKHLQTKYLVFVAGISSIIYPYFIAKFIIKLFGNAVIMNNEYLNIALKIFGGIGFMFFNLNAIATKNVLNFIIALSFAQTSLFAFCLPFFTGKQVIIGIIFAITSNGIIKVCLLAMLSKIQEKTNITEIKKTDISNISCLSYKILFIALLFFVAGMPLSLVFMSKWYLMIGIFNSSSTIWLTILITGFAIDIFACFSFIRQIITKKEKVLQVKKDNYVVLSIIFVIFILIISSFFTGSFN